MSAPIKAPSVSPASSLLLTRDEAASELRLSTRTLDEFTRRGDIPAVYVGTNHNRRYRRTDLERYVAELPSWEPRL